jgi:DNA-directed RNA polymerase specialized sigma54-like protein
VLVEYEPMTDRYVAALNRGRQPSLRINPTYLSLASDKTQDRAARKYVSEKVGHARWLIDSLQQLSYIVGHTKAMRRGFEFVTHLRV